MIALVELPRNELNPPRGGISATVFDVRRGYSSSLGTHRGPPPLASPIVIVGSGRPFARPRVPLGDSFDGDHVQVRYALAQPLWPPAAIGTGGARSHSRTVIADGAWQVPQHFPNHETGEVSPTPWAGMEVLLRTEAVTSCRGCAPLNAARYRTMRFPYQASAGAGDAAARRCAPCRRQHAPACASRSRPAAELAAHIGCGEPVSRGRCVARQGGMRLRVVPAVYSANGAARIRIGKAAWVVSQRALPAGIAAASAAQQARR